ncbi:MAG: MBL fold metallo-hydrolase [Bacteroidales bacterium]|nr:MBL fold metallo-hydrolase [Bacteroidales bacterium]
MTIEFLGAAKEVTGSKHLITTNNGTKILLDCGLYQGKGMETDADNRNLGFNPTEIDYLILSHAHIDHSGLIPYIVKLGFRGTIITTPATRDLCAIMLPDSGNIQELDTITFNKKREKQGLPTVEPIYTAEDARNSMQYFISIPYDKEIRFGSFSIMFTDNGHILGSATCNIKIFDNGKQNPTTIAYTGDIGRYTSAILRKPQIFPQAEYIIMESTYGDRTHEPVNQSEQALLDVVKDTCLRKKGKLLIPSFAVGRSQEIINVLNNLWEAGKLPPIDVYVDSPLSVNATNIFRLHSDCFNDELKEFMKQDPDPFGFDSLKFIQSSKESKELNFSMQPMIIISASGMMEAGRIKHHIANNIEKKSTTILGVGYCSPTTLGHKILRGDKLVSIFGVQHKVNADIKRIEGYSAHADCDELIKFIDHQDRAIVKRVIVVHGEEQTQHHFAKTLKDAGFKNVFIPSKGDKLVVE